MTQISNMKVIGLMVDFLKIIKLWLLSIGFYGVWQLFATHHRTQYLKPHPLEMVYTRILRASCLMLEIKNLDVIRQNRGKWKGQQPAGVKPRTSLAWAATALPLSHNSRTTTKPRNPLHVLHRWYWMPVAHPAATQYVLLELQPFTVIIFTS